MAGDTVFTKYKEHLLNANIDHAATFHCALLISVNPDADTWWNWSAAMDHEAPESGGYSLMGQVIANPFVTMDTGSNEGEWHGDDVTWSSSTISAHWACVYAWNSVTASRYLLAAWDFGSYQTSSSGDFTIQWNTEGIINLT